MLIATTLTAGTFALWVQAQQYSAPQGKINSQAQVHVLNEGFEVEPSGSELKIEVVPNHQSVPVRQGIPARRDPLYPGIGPQAKLSAGEDTASALSIPIDTPLGSVTVNRDPLTDAEREELEMWRLLSNSPILVTIEGDIARIEWAGAKSQVDVPPHGTIRIQLSPRQ